MLLLPKIFMCYKESVTRAGLVLLAVVGKLKDLVWLTLQLHYFTLRYASNIQPLIKASTSEHSSCRTSLNYIRPIVQVKSFIAGGIISNRWLVTHWWTGDRFCTYCPSSKRHWIQRWPSRPSRAVCCAGSIISVKSKHGCFARTRSKKLKWEHKVGTCALLAFDVQLFDGCWH